MPCCKFLPLHPQIVDHLGQDMSGLIFQTSSYPQHGFEGITLLPTSGRLYKEVLYIGIKFKNTIRICCNNISLF